MTVGRTPRLFAALFLAVGLAAMATTSGRPAPDASPAACSSCDARQQSFARIRATLAEETTP
jgi:hypothetical protein